MTNRTLLRLKGHLDCDAAYHSEVLIKAYQSSTCPPYSCELLTLSGSLEQSLNTTIVLPTGTAASLQRILTRNNPDGPDKLHDGECFCALIWDAASFQESVSEAAAVIAFQQRLDYFTNLGNNSLAVRQAVNLVTKQILDLVFDADKDEPEMGTVLDQRLNQDSEFFGAELWCDPECFEGITGLDDLDALETAKMEAKDAAR